MSVLYVNSGPHGVFQSNHSLQSLFITGQNTYITSVNISTNLGAAFS